MPCFRSSFFYWTGKVDAIQPPTDTDANFALTTPEGKNVPAPWVPFTRAGCTVGAFSTANIVLERTPFDVIKVFGANSPQAMESTSTSVKPNQTDEFEGASIHCALSGITDHHGVPITGFQSLGFDPTPAQTLAVVEDMLKASIPVVYAYIADAAATTYVSARDE